MIEVLLIFLIYLIPIIIAGYVIFHIVFALTKIAEFLKKIHEDQAEMVQLLKQLVDKKQ